MSLSYSPLYEFGNFRLDAVSRRLLRDGQIVSLTPKVFDLLLVLVESRGHVVSKGVVESGLAGYLRGRGKSHPKHIRIEESVRRRRNCGRIHCHSPTSRL